MKYAFYREGSVRIGIVEGDKVRDAAEYVLPSGLSDPIILPTRADGPLRDVADVQLLPPAIRPAGVYAVGVNYGAHAAEFGRQAPADPFIFRMGANCLLPHRGLVRIPPLDDQIDYEAELAVIIGSVATQVGVEDALDHVLGYACANDISARVAQKANNWVFGKGCDTFLPLGPFLVTADEVGDPQALELRGYVNGELRQSASTGDMINSVAQIIAFISQAVTLFPGDVICTGTCSGVGLAFDPPRMLKPGDQLRVDISRVGTLENSVAAPR